MGKLDGKVAVISGGSSGIGPATAIRFVAEGATVFVTGRRQAELDAAVALIGPKAIGVRGDVANLADLDRLYATVAERSGKFDVLFANAGVGKFSPLEAVTEEHFDQIFDVNVRGLLFSVQKALPLLNDGGSILLNASIVSIKGNAAFGVYSASKAAVRSFARTWAVDLKARGIRVNAISPGLIPTPAYETALGMNPQQIDEFTAAAVPQIPAGRPGTADEIGKAAVFLASDDSSYVNGIELFVDGGFAQI